MLFRSDKKDNRERGGTLMRLPLLPLRDIIVFPHMVVPLFVGRQTIYQSPGRGGCQ